jgi:hypothetical protein
MILPKLKLDFDECTSDNWSYYYFFLLVMQEGKRGLQGISLGKVECISLNDLTSA